jgi:hypothetical protein
VSAESFMRFLWGRMAFHWLIQGRIFGHGSCQAYIRVPRIVRVATEYIVHINPSTIHNIRDFTFFSVWPKI